MAAVLAPLPRRRRPAARLLAAAVALFAATALLLAASVLHSSRVQLRFQLPLAAWAGSSQPAEQPDPAQQRWLERMPPLPTGDAAQPAGGDADDPLAVLGPDYVGEEGAVRVIHVPQHSVSVSSSRFSGGAAAAAAAAAAAQRQQPATVQPATAAAEQAVGAAAAGGQAAAGGAAAVEPAPALVAAAQAAGNATASTQGACSHVSFGLGSWLGRRGVQSSSGGALGCICPLCMRTCPLAHLTRSENHQ